MSDNNYSHRFRKFQIKNWDEKSSVRGSPNRYALPQDIDIQLETKYWFLPRALPWLSEPAIQNLSSDIIHVLLARYLVFFLEYTTALEHKIVNPAVEIIAHDELGLGIPVDLKLAAFQLYTDEGYHAFVAAAVATEVSEYYGLKKYDKPIQRIQRLQNLIDSDPAHAKLATLVAGFVSETSITKELLDFTSEELVGPSYHMLRDHLTDELQHSNYFSHVFHCVWLELDDSSKIFASTLMVQMIREFFRLDDAWLTQTLAEIGVSNQDAIRIQRKLQEKDVCIARARSGATGTVKALKKIGFFNYGNNLMCFIDAGLVYE